MPRIMRKDVNRSENERTKARSRVAVCVVNNKLNNYQLYRSHPAVLSIQLVKYVRRTQQLTLKFIQLSATSF